MKSIYIILSLILLTSSATFAQSQFLEDGEDGMAFGIGVQNNEKPSKAITSLLLGYGVNGKFDLGVLLGMNSDVTIYSPFIKAYILKQNDIKKMPLSFGFHVQADLLRSYGISTNSFSFGSFIERDFATSQNSGIVPFFAGYYSTSNGENIGTYGGGFSIYTGKNSIFALDFGYFASGRNNSIVFNFSVLFKSSSNGKIKDGSYHID